jgi:hypothetical protein
VTGERIDSNSDRVGVRGADGEMMVVRAGIVVQVAK